MKKPQRAGRRPNNNSATRTAPRVFGREITRDDVYRTGIAAFATVLLFMALLARMLPQSAPFKVGQVATRSIKAPRSATYTDREKTAKAREAAAAGVADVYKSEPTVDAAAETAALNAVARIFARVREARQLPTQDERRAYVQAGLVERIPEESISILVRCEEAVLPQLEEWTANTVQHHMRQDILPADVDEHRRQIALEIENSTLLRWYRPAVVSVAQVAIRRNRVREVDVIRTEQDRSAAKRAVANFEETIAPDEVIISEGETVTQRHIDMIEALGLIRPKPNYGQGIAIGAIVLCLVVLFGLYLRERAPEAYSSKAQLLFIAACIIGSVTAAQLAVSYPVFPAVAISAVSLSAMVISALLALHTAVVATVVMSLLCGIAASGSDPRIIIATAAAGIVGAFAASVVARRSHVAAAAAVITASANSLILLAANGAFSLGIAVDEIVFTIIGGILAGVFAVIAVLLFDRPLGITTDMRLAELANPNSALLRRMMEEAPGTYMSSMMLASWCETCAAAIGGNPLLARVGTYYHDIGKLEKPFYFIENQFGERNPHDVLEPALSARIIARHTKDGYRMATELGLPQKVRDMTRMHHGTSLIKYFYHKAREQSGDGEVDESQFRHVGEKPGFKEAAVLMIADTVEAAARTLNDPSPSAVEALVDRLTQDKIDDGQLDESDLTFDDVRIIRQVLVRTLNSMFHQRVPYPDDEGGRT